jgi:hypothetical protein
LLSEFVAGTQFLCITYKLAMLVALLGSALLPPVKRVAALLCAVLAELLNHTCAARRLPVTTLSLATYRALSLACRSLHPACHTGAVQSLDAATLASLSPQGKKHSEELQSAIAGSTQKRRRSGERERAAGPPDVLLRCVLSKAAVERAAALLMLEADLRGQPELQPLLGKGGPPHSTARAAHRQLQPQHVEAGMVDSEALEPEQVPEGVLLPPQQPPAQPGQLWRRLEQAFAGEAADVDDIPDVAAAAAVAAEVVAAQTKLQRRRRGRKLSAEECLVLGILSNPRLGFAQATSLPGIDAAP